MLLFVAIAVSVFASPVDPQRAMQVAKQFVPQSSVQRAPKRGSQAEPSSSIVYTHMMPGSDRPAFYIVNVNDGSFVLVSADDVAHPVLGYSLTSKWPVSADGSVELPAHIKGFFDDLAAQMEAAIEAEPNLAPDATWTGPKRVLRSPSRSSSSLPDSVGPLLTTTWNQGQYYNALCPEDVNGPDSLVQNGCVATAMAQIIKYWGDSVQIRLRGTHSYDSNYGTLTVDYSSESYDFANMPNELTAESTPDQVTAVAKLIYHCGVATNMSYGATESSAFDVDARAGLINFYRFSPDLSYVERSFFTDVEWNNLLRENIAASRPIIYSGHGVGDHSFILDGYKNDDYYHFNFGWGGFADGWYLTNAVNPGALNFSSNQTALVGIVPDNTSNIILGQTAGTSTFTVDEPLEFYHLLGHNKYEGSYYNNPCNHTITFLPSDDAKQLVADIVEFKDQQVQLFNGTDTNNRIRSLTGEIENNLSPIVSTTNAITINYVGNMYYSGFKLYISQESDCRMVSNVTYSVDTTTVHLYWVENGDATQWEIEYGIEGFELGKGTTILANDTIAEVIGLTKFVKYDFYIRPLCGVNWYGPITIMTDAPYWIDIITSQPSGYAIDENGNVTISSIEGLAWWAKLANEHYNYWRWLIYNEPFTSTIDGLDSIKLHEGWYANRPTTIITDINLAGYKWKPIHYSGDIDGQMHTIANMTIIEKKPTSDTEEPYYGFLAGVSGQTIKNIVFQDPMISCPNGYYGVLAGGVLSSTIKNVGVNNANIIEYSSEPFISIYNVYGVAGGGLFGHIELTRVDNCYSTGNITSRNPNPINGGLVGYARNLSSFNNCYSSVKITANGGKGSISAYADGLSMRNCYGINYPYPILDHNDQNIGGIVDTIQFDRNTQQLIDCIYFDSVPYNNLLDALNKWVLFENSEELVTWTTDNDSINNGFPVLFEHYLVTCPNVENLNATNIISNDTNAILVTWDNDNNVKQCRIKCLEADSLDNTAKYYLTDSNSIIITELTIGRQYRIFVKPIYDETHQGGWGEGIEHIFEKPYWTDLVSKQPEGYLEDSEGNVTITSTEGFVWLSCVVNGLHGQECNNYRGKRIKLMTDVDLSHYRWMPIGNTWNDQFEGSFDGGNHVIRNVYISEEHDWVGLFGHVWQGQFINITIENGVIKGQSNVGTICGFYQNTDINYNDWWAQWNFGEVVFDNCHIENTSVYGDNLVGGIVGRIESHLPVTIKNCSSSGRIHGSAHVGGLFGNVKDSANIENCYSTCDVYSTNEYTGGIVGFVKDCNIQNCYATGKVETSGWSYGKTIGYLCDNITGNYIYALNDDLCPLIGPYDATSTINNTDWFSNSCVLENAITVDGVTYTDLLSALNAWVDANYTNSKYRHWIADTANVNGGYPIFAPLPNSIVTFQNYDSTILQKDTLNYNSLPVYRGVTPSKEATAHYTFTFKCWTPAIVPATEDAVYIATYDSIVNKYVITFCNEDNTVLQTDTLEYGATPSYRGITPVKESTTLYTYTFSGWSSEISAVTSNAIYIATFDSVYNKYILTYKVDGTIIQTDTLNYATAITPLTEPTKEGYTFSGWSDIPQTMPANDVEVTGSFSINSYLLMVMIDDEVVYSDSIEFGTRLADYVDVITKQGIDITQWEWYSQIETITMPAHDVAINAIRDAVLPVTEDSKKTSIYDLTGKKIETDDISSLPAGIYIREGKKILIQ